MEGRWDDALAAFDTVRQVNALGLDTRADTVEELSALLAQAGVDTVAWYGVRLFTDNLTTGNLTTGNLTAGDDAPHALFLAELEASRRDPYRQLSRLFHLIGIRRPGR